MESNKGKLAGNIAAAALVLGTATAAFVSAASNMNAFPLDAPSPTATPEATPSSTVLNVLEKKTTPKAAPIPSPVEIKLSPSPEIEKKQAPKPVVTSAKPTPKPEPTQEIEPVAYSYSKADLKAWAKKAVGSSQFSCLNTLWEHESGWNYKAKNPSSGAYGIPQSLPGSKMASAGSDWRTNPYTQMKWGLSYIKNRYGTPCGAYDHFKRKNWY